MNVIFVCNANIGRSQVAEALFNLRSSHKATSAGVRVDQHMRENNVVGKAVKDGAASPHSIPFMLERGVDVSENQRTQLTPEMANAADLVVAILDSDQKVDYLAGAQNVEFWDMLDPAGHTQTFADGVFMEIEKRVEELVSRIG
ncbi:MAG: low molecular weight phosphatase family protein [Chloroflexi bacterium]|nr:low molecular weight phosphatase family protein [Chloroflexota bacterium]